MKAARNYYATIWWSACFAFCMRLTVQKDSKFTKSARKLIAYVMKPFSATLRLLQNYVIVKTYQSKPLATTEVIALNDLSAYAPPFAHCVSPNLRNIWRSQMERPRSQNQRRYLWLHRFRESRRYQITCCYLAPSNTLPSLTQRAILNASRWTLQLVLIYRSALPELRSVIPTCLMYLRTRSSRHKISSADLLGERCQSIVSRTWYPLSPLASRHQIRTCLL